MRNDSQDQLYPKGRLNISQQLSHWRVAAASVRGTSHEKVGQLCQDAHHWQKLPQGVLVAAVADGAGSATLGKVGAIVATQTAVETICCQEAKLHLAKDEQEWQQILIQALEAAKAAVEAEAAVCGMQARDLATTLIIVVAKPGLIAAIQVGDGLAVAGDRAGNMIALTAAQRGEYINETTFLVSPHALDTVQVTLWRGAMSTIAVFSDGLQMLAVNMSDGTPYVPFFSPLFQFIADVEDENEAKEQLAAFLRSPRITERTDDDLTLLLATLVS
jgi:serine/threonine protein phosphatase PrpC